MDLSNIALSVVMNHSVCEELKQFREENKLLKKGIKIWPQLKKNSKYDGEVLTRCFDIYLIDPSNTALSVVLNQSVCEELKQLREENKLLKKVLKNFINDFYGMPHI
jgi:hypothetical protein